MARRRTEARLSQRDVLDLMAAFEALVAADETLQRSNVAVAPAIRELIGKAGGTIQRIASKGAATFKRAQERAEQETGQGASNGDPAAVTTPEADNARPGAVVEE